jgi:hypothetical protein
MKISEKVYMHITYTFMRWNPHWPPQKPQSEKGTYGWRRWRPTWLCRPLPLRSWLWVRPGCYDSFPKSVTKDFCDQPLPKYLDSKTVLIYCPHPVVRNKYIWFGSLSPVVWVSVSGHLKSLRQEEYDLKILQKPCEPRVGYWKIPTKREV